nr:hypothetical protein [Pandoravirus aubagnensis]
MINDANSARVANDADNAGPSVSYQDALTLDMQDTIMRRLAVADPQAALNLMSASTAQRMLGQSSARALKALGGVFVDNGGPATLGDYVRASIALGAHADPQTAALTQMQWLMMAYARLICSSPRARALVAPLVCETPSLLERFDSFHGTHAYVSAEYVRDWYTWTTNTQPVDAESTLSREWKEAVGSSGRPAPSMQMAIDIMVKRGVEVGCGPGSVRLSGAHFMPVAGFDDTTLARLIASSGASERDITAQDIATWRTVKPAGSLPIVQNVLSCPEAAAVVKQYLSRAVAEHMCKRGRQIETMTPLAFPRFANVFDTRIVFAPTHVDTLLLIAVRSTVIEGLLQEANLPL